MRSFIQTTEWLKFQEAIGHKTWRFDDGKIKANIIQHKIAFGKNYLYIPHGPEISFNEISGGLKNEVDNFLKYVKELAKENKSIFVKFEPLTDTVAEVMFRKGIKKSKKQIQPSKTVILNLELSEEDLLSRMHHKTRYNIKVADKHGIIVKDSDDLDAFFKLLDKTAKRDKFSSHSKEYYKKLTEHFNGDGMNPERSREGSQRAPTSYGMKVDLVMAYQGDKALAGALVMTYGDICYYLHGASDRDARNMMAPYALHWENIKYLKSRGVKFYDLWGIDAQKWPGVTRFKLGWGGDTKEYPGSFDIPISKFWYFVYNLARKIF